MGQRHQAFVIARVQGRYRCVALFHSQWFYGPPVVEAAARIIRGLVNPINAAAIASELASLEGMELENIAHRDHYDHENPPILCPYLTGLFLSSYRVNMFQGQAHMLHLLPLTYLPSRCNNNEGFTCFDVTEPGKPRYCFWWPGTGPLTPTEYLSRSTVKNKYCAPNALGILGHFALLELSTLATVWPTDFDDHDQVQESGMAQPHAGVLEFELPNSPTARSAVSAYDALHEIQTFGPFAGPPVDNMVYDLFMLLFHEQRRHLQARFLREDVSDESPAVSPSALSAASAIRGMLTSDHALGLASIRSTVEELVIGPGHLGLLRTELLEVKELSSNGFALLKQLLVSEKSRVVDLRPWVSTGALDASRLIDLSDALQHVELLNLSLSLTLTAEIVQDLVPRLSNLKHLVALGCANLNSLATALPLTTYLASMPLHEAVDQNRLVEPTSFSPPECLRWVEDSDPPAGLSVVMFSPSLSLLSDSPETRRFGLELAHFGAEGVVHGFAFWMEHLYDPEYRPGLGSCYFEMRAYFHPTGVVTVDECIPEFIDSYGPSFAFGCMPSLIKDVSPDDGRVYPKMETAAATDGVTRVPRCPGWVLVFDTKGTMPYHQLFKGMSREERFMYEWNRMGFGKDADATPDAPIDTKSASDTAAQLQGDSSSSAHAATSHATSAATAPPLMASQPSNPKPPLPVPTPRPVRNRLAPPSPPPPDNVPRPEYAFEWWDVRPGEEAKGLQPLERLSVREWVGRLPAGHGKVDPKMLAYCEHVLARLHVVLRGSNPERLAFD